MSGQDPGLGYQPVTAVVLTEAGGALSLVAEVMARSVQVESRHDSVWGTESREEKSAFAPYVTCLVS